MPCSSPSRMVAMASASDTAPQSRPPIAHVPSPILEMVLPAMLTNSIGPKHIAIEAKAAFEAELSHRLPRGFPRRCERVPVCSEGGLEASPGIRIAGQQAVDQQHQSRSPARASQTQMSQHRSLPESSPSLGGHEFHQNQCPIEDLIPKRNRIEQHPILLNWTFSWIVLHQDCRVIDHLVTPSDHREGQMHLPPHLRSLSAQPRVRPQIANGRLTECQVYALQGFHVSGWTYAQVMKSNHPAVPQHSAYNWFRTLEPPSVGEDMILAAHTSDCGIRLEMRH